MKDRTRHNAIIVRKLPRFFASIRAAKGAIRAAPSVLSEIGAYRKISSQHQIRGSWQGSQGVIPLPARLSAGQPFHVHFPMRKHLGHLRSMFWAGQRAGNASVLGTRAYCQAFHLLLSPFCHGECHRIIKQELVGEWLASERNEQSCGTGFRRDTF